MFPSIGRYKFLLPIFIALAALLSISSAAFAQNTHVTDIALVNSGGLAKPVSSAQIDVCQPSDNAVPCTNHVQVYGSSDNSIPLTQPLQSDVNGNFDFWIPAGQYNYTITGLRGIVNFKRTVTVPCATTSTSAGCGGSFSRIQPIATALGSGDFSNPVSSGWGTGATITGINGVDTSFQFTITAGTTPSISPTVTLTFHDGPWSRINAVIATMSGGTGSFADIQATNNLNTVTLTYMDLPAATKTYTISVVIIGLSNTIPVPPTLLSPVVQNPLGPQTITGQPLTLTGGAFNALGGGSFSGSFSGAPSATGLWTFGAGLTGTGNIGGLDIASGALGSPHTWSANQVFPSASIDPSKLVSGSNGQCVVTALGISSWGSCNGGGLTVNGGATSSPLNLGNLPAASANFILGQWQYSAGNASVQIPGTGNGATFCTGTGSYTSGHIVVVDASGNCVDGGLEQWSNNVVSNTCPTNGSSFATCTYTVQWPIAFATAGYKAECQGITPFDSDNGDAGRLVPNGISGQTTTTITLKISSAGASHVSYTGGVVCHGKL